MEEAVDFIKNINEKTMIIFDNDGDGIGSAAIFAKTFKTIFGKYPEFALKTDDYSFISEKIFRKRKKLDFIVTMDIPFDEKPEYILKFAKKSKVLIIDHHQVHENMNRYTNIVHINPEFFKTEIPSYKYCVSKLVYDIISKICNIESLDWLAGIGILNDKCEDVWKEFMENIYKKYNITQAELKIVNDIITSGYHYSGLKGASKGYEACLEAKSPRDILESKTINSKRLKKFYDAIEKEINNILLSWRKKAEIFNDKKLIILKINSKFLLNSPISTSISMEKPDYTVVVAGKRGNAMHISLRRQDKKINCGKLAADATNNLKNAKGGGHVPAAGASIMSKDWEIFRKRVLEML
ncbi:hypothetical protein A3K64_03020 [Candidatus Micrarchaeota archaeon RBG_16_36_9]|nr:MAG: hypothetical protein A3K64_03020 [Candidatus Micrarchaeota archaeon RBG_16_36_9]